MVELETPINRPDSPTPASGSSNANSILTVVITPSTPAPPGPAAALPALLALPAHPTSAKHALAILPPLQESTVCEGCTLNTKKPVNMEALLGFLVGYVNGQPYTYCTNGSGIWTEYVSVPGHFNGACTNCYYSNEESRCSFHICNCPLLALVAFATASAITVALAEAPASRHHSLRPHAPPAVTPSTTSCNNIAVVPPLPPPTFW
ncbi:hypothetical protein B7463_g12544, partial [Scytalidium lignicola]